jgi:hypothetical protein
MIPNFALLLLNVLAVIGFAVFGFVVTFGVIVAVIKMHAFVYELNTGFAVNINLLTAFVAFKACTFTTSEPVKVVRDSVDELEDQRTIRASSP